MTDDPPLVEPTPYSAPPTHLPGPNEPSPYPLPIQPLWKRALAPVAAVGAFLVKFGAVIIKLKAFVLFGSMAVSIWAYATLWGWQFGVGFVALIFVHEMGHVVALRRRGVKSGLPVFLPFLGAFVSMKEMPRSAYVEAETALAGPVVGTVGAFGALVVHHYTGSDFWRALAFIGFLLNLFNLLPALPLDGGRVAGALHPAVWLAGLAALLVLEIYRPSPVLLIILVLGAFELHRRWRSRDSPASQVYFALQRGQRARIGIAYLGLVVILVVAAHATYFRRTL